MAELLIMRYNKAHEMGYKKGDIVEVRPDLYWIGGNHGWNKTAFVVIAVDGVSVNAANSYMDAAKDGDNMTARRAWKFLLDNVPNGVKTQLQDHGYYITDKATALQYIENKGAI